MSINCLEFSVVIISYSAVLDAIELLGYCADSPHSKYLIFSDNTAAESYTRKMAASSIIGKSLFRILFSLLLNQSAGLDSILIIGFNNECADSISRLTNDSFASMLPLFQKHPKLASYRRYHPTREVIYLMCSALLNKLGEVQMALRLNGNVSVGKYIF